MDNSRNIAYILFFEDNHMKIIFPALHVIRALYAYLILPFRYLSSGRYNG
jgi:hypothetical protein